MQHRSRLLTVIVALGLFVSAAFAGMPRAESCRLRVDGLRRRRGVPDLPRRSVRPVDLLLRRGDGHVGLHGGLRRRSLHADRADAVRDRPRLCLGRAMVRGRRMRRVRQFGSRLLHRLRRWLRPGRAQRLPSLRVRAAERVYGRRRMPALAALRARLGMSPLVSGGRPFVLLRQSVCRPARLIRVSPDPTRERTKLWWSVGRRPPLSSSTVGELDAGPVVGCPRG